ncbi:hypothetical protein MRB53_038756 [Persea americana]|nr:hypothetical protein MRB53_038756 [Persea americana]
MQGASMVRACADQIVTLQSLFYPRGKSPSSMICALPAMLVDSIFNRLCFRYTLDWGVGVGGLLLVAIIAIIVQIVRKTRQHSRRSVQLLEAGQITNVTTEIRRSSDIRRTLSIGRRATVQLSNEKAPWNPLASTETLEEPAPTKKRLRSIRLPKRSKKNDVKLKSLKHLSAIAESPRSRAGQSPVVPDEHHEMRMEHGSWPVMHSARDATQTASNLSIVEPAYSTIQRSSQLESLSDDDRPKPPRSVSMGALIGTTLSEPLLTASLSVRRLRHARSASLGDKPPEFLPPDPVPSLPVISPHR